MGQLPPENNGLLSGIVGNVVFVKAKSGGTIVRSRPAQSKKAPSDKKQETWDKFSLVSGFITPVYPFFKKSFTDLLTLMLYLPDTQEYLFFQDCAQWAAAQLQLDLPDAIAGTPFYVWATFSDAATGIYANSTYLGLLP